MRDEAGDEVFGEAAEGSAQNLGVHGPFGYRLGFEGRPGVGVAGVVEGEDVLEGAGGGVSTGERLTEVPGFSQRGDQRCVSVLLVVDRVRARPMARQ